MRLKYLLAAVLAQKCQFSPSESCNHPILVDETGRAPYMHPNHR